MKIKAEHIAIIETKFVANKDKIKSHKAFLNSPENPRKPEDFEMRLRWDALASLLGSKWICDTLYPYLNDSHIDSALRAVMAKI